MAITHVSETTVGAPNSGRISGTNGDLYAMMKYAVQLQGWAVEYDDTINFACVLRPGTGNRFRLHLNDNSATSGNAGLCVVRGCENASAATTLVDPFPTVALVANGSSNWVKSSAASTTARNFDIWVGDTWVIYAVNLNGTNIWDFHFFGDAPSNISGDTYNTICTVRNSASAASSNMYPFCTTSGAGASGRVWWARSYDGTLKSTQGGVWAGGATSIGVVGNYPAPQSGPTTKIDRRKISVSDTGSTTTTASNTLGIVERGWIPNIWAPLHNGYGSLNARDTFTDTAYNASSSFQIVNTTTNTAFAIIETTDTWAKPSG